jgi:hypothetical protein
MVPVFTGFIAELPISPTLRQVNDFAAIFTFPGFNCHALKLKKYPFDKTFPNRYKRVRFFYPFSPATPLSNKNLQS